MILLFSFSMIMADAQDDPVTYLNMVNKAEEEANQKYLVYVSTAAHSQRIRKIEKMRLQAIDGIISSRDKSVNLPYYKGDNSLRKASIDYLNFLYLIFREEYAKIINTEDIAEQSINEMQAFLLLQEKTAEKLHEASEKRNLAQKEFAKKYNIQLVESKSENDEKAKKAGKVIKYRNSVYLQFFKCNWQWGELNKAIGSKKIIVVEQARTSLISYVKEGLAALDTIKSFEGDPLLANACRSALMQYKRIAENEISKITDFFLKEENFQKIKRSFEGKPDDSRTKEDIANYNKAVNEINASVIAFNTASQEMTKIANGLLEEFNKADKEFSDTHTPYFRR